MAWQTPKTNWGQPGQTVPRADDFNRIEGNIETLGRYDRAPGYGTATGTNAKTITLDPAPTNYYDGLCFAFKNVTQNTGAVTINVNGLGARPIKKPNGNDIAAGNLKANSVYTVRYNGTNFILQGEGGEYGNVTPGDVIKGVTFGTEEGLKTGTLELTGNAAASQVLTGRTFYTTNPKSKLTGTMPNHGSKTFTPSDNTQTSGAGYYSGITVNPRPSLSGNASTSQVLSGRTFYGSNYTKQTGTMPNRGAVTNTITTQGGSYTIPAGYHNGSGKVTASFSNLVASNIKQGVNIGGVTGSLKPAIGYNWTIQTPPLEGKGITCLYSGNDIQMCVMYEDTVNYKPLLFTRTSTTNWVQRTIPFTKYAVRSIVYGNGLYVMTGSTPSKYVATSSDGISWTLRSVPFNAINEGTNSLFYEDGLFIVGGVTADGAYATSTNGTSWTRRAIGSSGTVYSITKGKGLWVMGFSENIYTSTNGTSWVNRGKPFSQSDYVLSLCYGKGLYIAGGNNGVISTSTDGINWTQRTNLSGNVRALVYNSGLFLAGTDTGLYSSEDGINWVQRFSEGYDHIAWGDLLLAGGYNGSFAYSSL